MAFLIDAALADTIAILGRTTAAAVQPSMVRSA